ncbi:MAG: 1,4-dihydroxy-2-naphthoate polyprenyltransferase [Anaerolineae bacterium]|nr:1,4-dihydroxy-2-naphthoate polyprenyltransferase [Anaerolineae bacterium]
MPSPWILAARPKTLPASIAPVLSGTALAAREGTFDPLVFAATLLAAILLQVGANYANDVFDFLKGADRNRQGPLRVTQSGLLSPRQMLWGTGVVFALAALVGVGLVSRGGWVVLVIGVLSILAALAYTAGPLPLAYRGLGELAAFTFFGLVAASGTYYLQAGTFTLASWLVGVPQAALAAAILVVNNLRDIDADRAAGKYTLAARFGERFARWEYAMLVALAFAALVPLRVLNASGWSVFLPLLLLIPAAQLVHAVMHTPRSAALNPLLARTAQLNLAFAVLLAVGLLLPS